MPCPHIYDPVCGSTFGDNSAEEELREFPNECSMNRFNCEWNQRKYKIRDHFILSLALLDTGLADSCCSVGFITEVLFKSLLQTSEWSMRSGAPKKLIRR